MVKPVLIQVLPSCLGQTENDVEELQILVHTNIACLEFTLIHMQTLTQAMFNTDTVLILIGATRQHFEINNQHK